MGDAQFEGGGSVKWEINHSDGETGSGNKHKSSGRDKDPKNGGFFAVTITGVAPIFVPASGTTVRVIWGDQATPEAVAAAAPKKAKSKSAKSKSKG